MHAVVGYLWGIPVHAWPLAFGIGMTLGLAGGMRAYERAHHESLSPAFGVSALLGAVIGAKALALLLNVRGTPGGDSLFAGGFAELGGFLGGAIASSVYLRRRRIALLPVFDAMAPYAALTVAIVRVGCFLNGCCRGTPSSLPWAVRFPNAVADEGAPVHPVQMYYAVVFLLLFAYLRFAVMRMAHPGARTYSFLIAFLCAKLVIEHFRLDESRYVFGLNVAQSVAGISILGLLLWRLTLQIRPRPQRDP